jgi:outer membrane immunogenic protein
MLRNPLAITAAVLVGIIPGSAVAQDGGLRATALGGLERTDAAPGTGASDGVYFGGQLGYDAALGPVLIGVESEVGESTAKSTLAGNHARQGLFANAAVRLAIPISGGFRGFVRGGYAYHRISYDTGPDFDGSGYTLGGGAEADLSDRLFLRGEYRFSDYGTAVRGQHFLLGLGVRF